MPPSPHAGRARLAQSRETLQRQIAAAEEQLARLRTELARTEQELELEPAAPPPVAAVAEPAHDPRAAGQLPLSLEEYRRYGRQMILPAIGLPGQLALRNARVLIVGAGGLGSPAALYLAAAGVGTLGLVDNDSVDTCNLHRQVLHTTPGAAAGKHKVDSAAEALAALNPHVTCVPHRTLLTAANAEAIFTGYDVVLDCSDNPATRYLVSDTAVLLGQPLVSASALATEGQLMVLNYPPAPPGDDAPGIAGGPCYRCIFPRPPPAASVMKCAEGGVLGPVVGVMGVMQALEAIKVIVAMGRKAQGQTDDSAARFVPTLHLFSGYANPPFRSVKLRGRRPDCKACSRDASVTLDVLRQGTMDYVVFCGSKMPVSLLADEERIDAAELARRLACPPADRPIMIDTRDETQFGICSIAPDVVNVPIAKLMALTKDAAAAEQSSVLPSELLDSESTRPVVAICRMGNDSQRAVQKLKELGLDMDGRRAIMDLRGGVQAWSRLVDPAFPEY
ncbi:Urmylation protein [Ascosphaera acerosa]|nr:Urmylation protein [Ascosphaera acerosa]